MILRTLKVSKNNSFFLFGARGTGKTHYLRNQFGNDPVLNLDLLDDETFWRLSKNPSLLNSEYAAHRKTSTSPWIVIDEVQRVPNLLNVVHQMLEAKTETPPLFALTGSSSRRLKRGGANLLGGRAFVFGLFPFTHIELAESFDLMAALSYGTLPKIIEYEDNKDRVRFLRSYVSTYIKEEIIAEQILRKVEPFRDFLHVSAQMSSRILNVAKIATDVGVDPKTVSVYFAILEETYMGFRLPAFHESIRKAQRLHPKFYWFDSGVRRTLTDTVEYPPAPGTSYFGELFEEFVINEIYRMNSYSEQNFTMSYLATQNSRTEVDLILDKAKGRVRLGVEIKSSTSIDESEVLALSKIGQAFKATKLYYLSQCPQDAIINGVHCMEWRRGIREIFPIN